MARVLGTAQPRRRQQCSTYLEFDEWEDAVAMAKDRGLVMADILRDHLLAEVAEWRAARDDTEPDERAA